MTEARDSYQNVDLLSMAVYCFNQISQKLTQFYEKHYTWTCFASRTDGFWKLWTDTQLNNKQMLTSTISYNKINP